MLLKMHCIVNFILLKMKIENTYNITIIINVTVIFIFVGAAAARERREVLLLT